MSQRNIAEGRYPLRRREAVTKSTFKASDSDDHDDDDAETHVPPLVVTPKAKRRPDSLSAVVAQGHSPSLFKSSADRKLASSKAGSEDDQDKTQIRAKRQDEIYHEQDMPQLRTKRQAARTAVVVLKNLREPTSGFASSELFTDDEEERQRDDDANLVEYSADDREDEFPKVEESSDHPKFGTLIWVRSNSSDPWWPAIVFRASKYLPLEVRRLFAKRKRGMEFLVCYCDDKGQFAMASSKHVKPFTVPVDWTELKNMTPKLDKAVKHAIAQLHKDRVERKWLSGESFWDPVKGEPEKWIYDQRRPMNKKTNTRRPLSAASATSSVSKEDETLVDTEDKSAKKKKLLASDSLQGIKILDQTLADKEDKSTKKKKRKLLSSDEDDDSPQQRMKKRKKNVAAAATFRCNACLEMFASADGVHAEDAENGFCCLDCQFRCPCQVCFYKHDADTFLLCSSCTKGCHLYCAFRALTDEQITHWDDAQTKWECPECVSAKDPALMDVITSKRYNQGRTEYLLNGKWMPYEGVSAAAFGHFSFARSSPVCTSYIDMSEARLCHGSLPLRTRTKTGPSGKVQETEYFFLNGTPFGIKQYHTLFPGSAIAAIEKEILFLMESEANLKSRLLRAETVDYSLPKKRFKIFLGYRYAYGAGMSASTEGKLFSDVDELNAVGAQLESAASVVGGVILPLSVNQIVINAYCDAGSSLGVHRDSEALFQRPIASLRLFSDSVLSFGCSGIGAQETPRFCSVPLSRGTVTVMLGIAADRFTHCVKSKDVKAPSVSVLFRQVKTEKTAKAEKTASSPNINWSLHEDAKRCMEMFCDGVQAAND